MTLVRAQILQDFCAYSKRVPVPSKMKTAGQAGALWTLSFLLSSGSFFFTSLSCWLHLNASALSLEWSTSERCMENGFRRAAGGPEGDLPLVRTFNFPIGVRENPCARSVVP